MGKLVTHVAVAILLVVTTRGMQLPLYVSAIAVIVGAVAVHLVWERLVPDPFAALPPLAVSDDDPLMIDAKQRAAASLPVFVRIFPEHVGNTIVKFPLQTSEGKENVWGDLLELSATSARVYLRTPPVGEIQLQDRTMAIAPSDIVDWQIIVQDGTLRGGYTMQAAYKIFERENGFLPKVMREELQRYRPLEPPAA